MIQDHASMAGRPDGGQDIAAFEVPRQDRRRITAESFRLLTARLKAKPAPAIADLGFSCPVPAPLGEPPVPETFWPVPGLPEEPIAESEVSAPAPVATLPVDNTVPTDIALTAFLPLWPLEPETEPDLAAEAQDISEEAPDESVTPEMQDTAALENVEFVAEPPYAPPPFEALKAPHVLPPFEVPEPDLPSFPKAAQPLAERVVDAMLQTVTEAIYAKPTEAERAAFLRDVAELIEKGEDKDVLAEVSAPPEPLPMAAFTIDPPTVVQEPEDIPVTLAEKLGPSSALLRKQPGAPDPFSKTIEDAIRLTPKPAEMLEADPDSGELALSLLDMMSAGATSGLPQERALAADTLLRMIPRVPVKQLIRVVERIAIMEAPPALLVAKLIRDARAEVVAPLLERCMHITDQDLMAAATEGDSTKRRMIARRRMLSPVLADHLIVIGDASTLLTLIRNPGASFSNDAFYRLADHASQHHSLLAPLATRADLPAPVAFELFWFVPQELRRFILSRFLTDSETLSKILKITLGAQDGGETKFPAKELLESVIDKAAGGNIDEAAQTLADIGGVCRDTALRILADPQGEPVTVLLKALGYPRGNFADSMERFKNSDSAILHPERNIGELESIFDTLSFNKARILLTYWDWFVQKSGPYAPQH